MSMNSIASIIKPYTHLKHTLVFPRSRDHPHQWPQPSFLCLRYIDLQADEPKACKAETRTAFAYIQFLQGRPPHNQSRTTACFSVIRISSKRCMRCFRRDVDFRVSRWYAMQCVTQSGVLLFVFQKVRFACLACSCRPRIRRRLVV